MEDRIEINGVWYVKEDSTTKVEIEDLDITEFQGCMHETNKYCWEATRILKYDDVYYDEIDIKFTDKRSMPWKKSHWDNNIWMKGVLNNNLESIKEAQTSMCDKGVVDFKLFLRVLKEKGWFN